MSVFWDWYSSKFRTFFDHRDSDTLLASRNVQNGTKHQQSKLTLSLTESEIARYTIGEKRAKSIWYGYVWIEQGDSSIYKMSFYRRINPSALWRENQGQFFGRKGANKQMHTYETSSVFLTDRIRKTGSGCGLLFHQTKDSRLHDTATLPPARGQLACLEKHHK